MKPDCAPKGKDPQRKWHPARARPAPAADHAVVRDMPMPERGGRCRAFGGDRGGVTVEAAVAVCWMVTVLVLGLGAVMAVIGQLRCTDAAREAGRLIARGEPERAAGVVADIAPEGAEFAVRRDGDAAWVEVRTTRLGVELRARAYVVLEPGVADAG